MKLLILTGMSGAGKSTAFKMLEDLGYYCVDNLPIPLLKSFIDLSEQPSAKEQKLVVGIDIRSGESLHLLQSVLSELRQDTAFSFWMLRMRYWSSVIRRPDGITHCPGRSVFRQASSRSGQRSDF